MGPDNDCWQCIELHKPARGDVAPLWVYVHGGGWRSGDKAVRIRPKIRLAHAVGAAFASVNYRLVPEVDVAEQADDVVAAVAYLRRRAGELAIDPNRIVLSGFSAGAHLAALVALDRRRRVAAFGSTGGLRGVLLIDPAGLDPAKLVGRPDDDIARYDRVFPRDPEALRAVSPMAHVVQADPLAPFLVVMREAPSVHREITAAFVERLTMQGVRVRRLEVDEPGHGELDALIGSSKLDATTDVEHFLARALG